MKKLLIGVLVSAVLVYFALKDVHFDQFMKGYENIKIIYLVPAFFIFLTIHYFRSVRMGIILSPLEVLKQRILFPITAVGFMAIALLPMRIGEIFRPYMINNESNIPMSSAIAGVFVERVFDFIVILFTLLLVILNVDLPGWAKVSGYILLGGLIFLIGLILLFYFYTDKMISLLKPILNKLPERIHNAIEGIIEHFVRGFKIIENPSSLLYTLILTLLIWWLTGFGIYLILQFHQVHSGILSAFLVLCFTVIGISLPTAPGFLGSFQFACIKALEVFGVTESIGLSISLTYYVLGVGLNIIIGLLFLPVVKLSYADVMAKLRGI